MKLRIFSLEGKDVEKTKEMLKDELFARESDGFEIRSAKGLGLEGERVYLSIEGNPDFWAKAEKAIEELGIEEVKGEEFDRIESAFKKQHERKALAVGSIFG